MKSYTKNIIAMMLSITLVFTIPLIFTQEASAASTGTKLYRPVKVVYKDSSGVTNDKITYKYNKKGLCSEVTDSDHKSVYTYNKKGLVKSWKNYDKDGKQFAKAKNVIKNGKVAATEYYNLVNGNAVLDNTTTYKYKNGKKSTETMVLSDGNAKHVITYRANGTKKKDVYSTLHHTEKETYDKQGNSTSRVYNSADRNYIRQTSYKNTYKKGKLVKKTYTQTDPDGTVYEKGKITYTYKKGRLAKSVFTADPANKAYTYVAKETVKYTYNKAGLLTKKVRKTVEKSPTEGTLSRTQTITIKYKKLKVDKKVKKAVTEAAEEFAKRYMPF